MRIEVDCIVIGAGVVGLAVAREAQRAGIDTLLLERNGAMGQETSSRNSEVIHAGIHYAAGSLKATLCVRGKQLLYEYCARHAIPHRRIGKIIVAVDQGEIARLEACHAAALANGVTDLGWLSAAGIAQYEPAIRACSGLLSPGTGIVDSHALMVSLHHEFEQAGGTTVFRCPVASGRSANGGIELQLGDAQRTIVHAGRVVNCAGLSASGVAGAIAGIEPAAIPQTLLAIGHYFTLPGPSPFRHLVYPIAPVGGGLGVHVTLDLAGNARFGPDLSWRSSPDYTFDEARAPAFYEAVRRYYPALRDGELRPGYTGIRPRLRSTGPHGADFMIQDASEHGIAGLVNLFGIESPGLTAALAIAEEVRAKL